MQKTILSPMWWHENQGFERDESGLTTKVEKWVILYVLIPLRFLHILIIGAL